MKEGDKLKLIELAKYYVNLNCSSSKELSKRTYELRERGVDIPYVMSSSNRGDGLYWEQIPYPTAKQKKWKFIRDEKWETPAEYSLTGMRIYDTPKGLLFIILTKDKRKDGKKTFTVEYTNRVLSIEEYREKIDNVPAHIELIINQNKR